MKNSLVRTIFDWLLIASLVLSVVFLYQFFSRTRELRGLHARVTELSQERQQRFAIINTLVSEANRYAERDPGMKQLLDSIRATAAAAATNPTPQPITQ